jgi:uncharacterized protein (TIRG00374 family)
MPHKNKILLSAIASVGIYLLWMALTDWQGIVDSIQSISAQGLIIVLALSLLNYVLRFVRWSYYLRSLGYCVPLLHNLNCYFAGFAFTTTPGKAGEALRSVFLEKHGVSVWHTIACVLVERIVDLVCVILLAALGIALFPNAAWLIVISLAGFGMAFVILRSAWFKRLWSRLRDAAAGTRLANLIQSTGERLRLIDQLWTARAVAAGLGLGLAAWAAEGIGLAIIVNELGYEAPLVAVVAIYALSMLAGAISMMPGGLGGAEASMTFMLTTLGMSLPEAVSATLICRAATLWFAVGLGVMALVPAAASPGLSVSRS